MISTSIFLSPYWLGEVIEHVRRHLPEEACGLLAGKEGIITLVIPIENQLHLPGRFRMEARAQLEAFSLIENEGLDLMAIFHSHPDGPSHPSEIDIREHAYPEALSIICFPDEDHHQWSLKAFRISDGTAFPVPVILE